jgi:formate hydrogenlyase transcriptional activator
VDNAVQGGASGRSAERYRTLLEISNALVSNLRQDALFTAIAAAVRRVVPFDRSAIFLHDPARDVLRLFVLETSLPSTYLVPGFEMPVASHVGDVVSRGRPLLRRDLDAERRWDAETWAWEDGVRSYVVVPLAVRGRPIGALAVASATPDRYTGDDVEFLAEVGRQVALAVDNMRSYEEIRALGASVAATASRSTAAPCSCTSLDATTSCACSRSSRTVPPSDSRSARRSPSPTATWAGCSATGARG